MKIKQFFRKITILENFHLADSDILSRPEFIDKYISEVFIGQESFAQKDDQTGAVYEFIAILPVFRRVVHPAAAVCGFDNDRLRSRRILFFVQAVSETVSVRFSSFRRAHGDGNALRHTLFALGEAVDFLERCFDLRR